MRYIVLLLPIFLFTACARHTIPPEISAMHEYRKPTSKKREVIIVDAGHGGKDCGAVSKRESYEEKELTLATALMIRNCLNQLGYKTIMTRDQDIFIPLSTRAEIANANQADLFVSIHYNYSASPDAKGVEVYYYKEGKTPPSPRIAKSKALSSEVLKKVVSNTGATSRGVKEANFAVVRETEMPAILVEAGFLSNPQEKAQVKDPQYQRKIAWGIAKGVDCYLECRRK